MRDQFTIWLKDKLKGKKVSPPEEAWQAISNQLDLDTVWNRVENQLDVDTVWRDTHQQLETDSKVRLFEKLAYLPLLLVALLIGIGTYDSAFKKSHSKQQISDLIQAQTAQNEKKVPFTVPVNKTDQTAEMDFIPPVTEIPDTLISKKFKPLLSSEMDPLLVKPYTNVPSISHNIQMETIKSIPGIFLGTIDLTNNQKNSWYYGMAASVKTGLLLNNKTLMSYENSDLISTRPDPTWDLSLHAGIPLSERWTVQANVVLLTQIRQTFGEYINGRYVVSDNRFNYSGMQLLVKRSMRPILYGTSSGRYAFAGAYANYLTKGVEKQLDYLSKTHTENNLKAEYRPLDAGLIAGLEFERNISPAWSLTYGLHASYGFVNIYSGDETVPGYLRRTKTATVGFQLGLRKRSGSKK